MLTEIKRPYFLIVHLKSILTYLLLDVPDLEDSIDTGRGNLKSKIQPAEFDQGGLMTL